MSGRERVAGRWRSLCEGTRARSVAGVALALACVTYFGLGLYLARGVGFTIDEVFYFGDTSGIGPRDLAEPFDGHLTAVVRLITVLSLRAFGAAHLPLEILTLLSVVVVAVLVFLLLSRWVGPLVALGPAVAMLFVGSTPEVLQGNAMVWVQGTAFGLAAFLAFDRDTRFGDVVAVTLLGLAVLSHEVGIAFSLAIGVWALVRGEPRRLWVAIVPLAIYAVWWLWARQFHEGITTFSNGLLAPSYTLQMLAAAAAAMTGLGIDFADPQLAVVDVTWGPVLLVLIAAVLFAGTRARGTVDPALWAVLSFIALFGTASALAYGPLRWPEAPRYAYPLVIALLLALGAAWRGHRFSPRAVAIVLGIVALTLPANLWLLRERGRELRSISAQTRASLAMIELERHVVAPGFQLGLQVPVPAAKYLSAVDSYGSPGYDLGALDRAAPAVRLHADQTLGAIIKPRLQPVPAALDAKAACRHVSPAAPQATVPEGGALIVSDAAGPAALRRFGDAPRIALGPLAADEPALLELPVDDSDRPWLVSVRGADVQVCPLSGQL